MKVLSRRTPSCPSERSGFAADAAAKAWCDQNLPRSSCSWAKWVWWSPGTGGIP